MRTAIQADDRRLRQFAVLWILFTLGLAIRYSSLTRPLNAVIVAGGLAVFLGVAGWLQPVIIRPLYVGWMIVVTPINWLVSHLVLAGLFFGLFTPIGLLLRVLGRDALNLKDQPSARSLWIPKSISSDPKNYLNQF
jgi:hypothetical protein